MDQAGVWPLSPAALTHYLVLTDPPTHLHTAIPNYSVIFIQEDTNHTNQKMMGIHPLTHFLKNVTLSCPTGGMLPRAACHWLTKSESASYWLTQSATYSILPPAQASCCSTLDMLSSYIVRGTVRHKFALTFRTEI